MLKLTIICLLLNLSLAEKCYDRVGCFSDVRFFIFKVPYPKSPDVVKTTFYFSSRNTNEVEMVWNSDFKKTGYSPKKKTVFIVHGYKSGKTSSPWMTDLKKAYLKAEDANVFLVDWSGGSMGGYFEAASNTQVVGKEIALMIERLRKEQQTKPEDVHLIGHSLGGQISGYAGRNVKNLGRITALDPAKPIFEFPKMLKMVSKNDGLFVETVHTDAYKLGMLSATAHIDFYMNTGKRQPGCTLRNKRKFSKHKQRGDSMVCSHTRAHQYYIEALNNHNGGCVFWGKKTNFRSSSIRKITRAGCDLNNCVPLGLNSVKSKVRGSVLVKTNANNPFCKDW